MSEYSDFWQISCKAEDEDVDPIVIIIVRLIFSDMKGHVIKSNRLFMSLIEPFFKNDLV